MTPTFRFGRIAGVQVGANWSVLVILALIVIGLAAGRLPLVAPGQSVLANAAVGALSGLAFPSVAAGPEEQQTVWQSALDGIQVADVMTPDPVTASPELTVQQFIDGYLMQHRFSTVPLVDTVGQLAGLVTLNRIRQVPDGQRATTRLADIACRPADLPVAAAQEPLVDLLPRMAGCSDGRAVVLDPQRRLVGIVSPSDVARTVQTAELRLPVGKAA